MPAAHDWPGKRRPRSPRTAQAHDLQGPVSSGESRGRLNAVSIPDPLGPLGRTDTRQGPGAGGTCVDCGWHRARGQPNAGEERL